MPRQMGPRLLPTLLLGAIVAGCRGESSLPSQPSDNRPREPRLSIVTKVINAGDVDYGVARDFTFEVANVGTQPLHLKVVRKTCTCADVIVSSPEIAPGQKGTVVLRWAPIPGTVGPYTFAADLECDDPSMPAPRLEVRGNINPLVRIHPQNWSIIDFSTMRPGDSVERELKVFSTRLDSFDLTTTLESPGFQVLTTPLQSGDTVGDLTVKSGYAVTLKTTDQLPRGYIREEIVLGIKAPDEPARKIILPVYGEVEQSVFRVTPREVEFRTAKVTKASTQKMHVRFFEPSEKEDLQVVKCEPAFLQWDPPRRLGSLLWEIAIHLPANSPEAARYQADGFFEGRIVLKASSSPTEVPVRVKWHRTTQ